MKGYRTIGLNLVGLVFALASGVGFEVAPENQAAISTGIMAVLNIFLRFKTDSAVGPMLQGGKRQGGFARFPLLVMLGLLSFTALLFGDAAHAQVPKTMTLSWDAPTAREDGTPISASELDHYTIFSVDNLGAMDEIIVPATELSYSMSAPPGSYTLAISVTDVYGLSSQSSEQKTVKVRELAVVPVLPVPVYRLPPGAPGGFRTIECSSNISCTVE